MILRVYLFSISYVFLFYQILCINFENSNSVLINDRMYLYLLIFNSLTIKYIYIIGIFINFIIS